MAKLRIDYPSTSMYRLDNLGNPASAYVGLDIETGEAWVGIADKDYVPMRVWTGEIQRWALPNTYYSIRTLRMILDTLAPMLQLALDSAWTDEEHQGQGRSGICIDTDNFISRFIDSIDYPEDINDDN